MFGPLDFGENKVGADTLAFVVTAFAATAGAEDWNVKTFWQQVDSNHN